MKQQIIMDAALREGGDGGSVLLENLNTFENRFQRLPVIFPVDQLALELVHHGADDKHGLVLPLGDEGQLTFGQAFEQNDGVGVVRVVGNQQEAAFRGHLFQTAGFHMNPQHHKCRLNDEICHHPVEPAVLFLGYILIHPLAQIQQKQESQQRKTQKHPRKAHRQQPEPLQCGKSAAATANSKTG